MKSFINKILLIVSCVCFMSVIHAQEVQNYVIDESFNSGILFREGGVMDLEPLEDGRIVVMNSCSDVTSPIGAFPIIFPDGSFSQNGSICPTCVGGSTFGLLSTYRDGFLYHGNGGLQKKTADFMIDASFRFEYSKAAYSSFIQNNVRDILIEEDDNILAVGGFFTDSLNLNDIDTRYSLVRVDTNGAPVPDFPMLQVGGITGPSYPEILSIDTLSTGEYILAGKFSTFGGYEYNNVGKLNADFSVDTTFVNSLVNRASVPSLFIDSQDRIWANTTYGGLLSNPSDTLPFVRLLPNGEIDPNFTPPDVRWEYESGFSHIAMISDILELPNGDFIFTGAFNRVNGLVRNNIMYMYEDGTVDETIFANLGADEAVWEGDTNCCTSINQMLPFEDGSILLGGKFSSFGGQPYSCLVKIRPQGVSVEEAEVPGSVKVFPNPANGYVQLKTPADQQIADRIVITDMSGKTVLQLAPDKIRKKISIEALPPGAYLISGFRAEVLLFRQKFIIE